MKTNFLSTKIVLSSVLFLTISNNVYAQNNVQIYGVLDYGYAFRHDRNENAKLNNISKTNSRLDSGQSSENWIGFRGSEDLGNGNQAFFLLERNFSLDTGVNKNGFKRQAYVGLQNSKYGSILGGMLFTPQYDFLRQLDPFHAGTVSSFWNVMSDISHETMIKRITNAVAYQSPKFKNFILL